MLYPEKKVKIIEERKISLKIISHKIRKYLPTFFYDMLITVRFFLFLEKCTNGDHLITNYSDGSWVARKTTSDLKNIEDYLIDRVGSKKILQVGIGNSSLYSKVGDSVSSFDGITIVNEEVDFAKLNFPMVENYHIFLMNKYSDDILGLSGSYDYIIDNDLSSYACCIFHFRKMLDNYRCLLSNNGVVLVGVNGLSYFDSGFGLTTAMMKKIANQHGFLFLKGQCFHILKKI